MNCLFLWFRNDLRLQDDEALLHALRKANKALPCFSFYVRLFAGTKKGLPGTGALHVKYELNTSSGKAHTLIRTVRV